MTRSTALTTRAPEHAAQPAASFPFADPTIPTTSGNTYHPYNIENIGGSLYVVYAKVGIDGRAEDGVGNGFVRRFNTNGVRDLTFGINNGPLNAPWGIVIAPASFGIFGGALLVGNFGEGNPSIHGFNPTTGAFLGTIQNESGDGIEIDRPEFVAAYGASTNAAYVDALLTNAGITPSQVRLFVVNLTNGQENPPAVPTTTGGAARPASFGTARFQLNAAQTAMTFSATINNIDVTLSQSSDSNDNLTAAHIHAGAAVTPATNGPVVWGFFGAPFNDNNPNDQVFFPNPGVGGTFSGKWDAPEGNGTTLAAQLTNLRTGHAYINFHTVQFGGGEIRGNFPAENTFRDSLVAGLDGATLTRAQVLRQVAESEEFALNEFNRAFVTMEYFGYLRRDPDAAGFNFWLNKLNAFNGNFVAAEMVKAFINSGEYRQRFGPA